MASSSSTRIQSSHNSIKLCTSDNINIEKHKGSPSVAHVTLQLQNSECYSRNTMSMITNIISRSKSLQTFHWNIANSFRLENNSYWKYLQDNVASILCALQERKETLTDIALTVSTNFYNEIAQHTLAPRPEKEHLIKLLESAPKLDTFTIAVALQPHGDSFYKPFHFFKDLLETLIDISRVRRRGGLPAIQNLRIDISLSNNLDLPYEIKSLIGELLLQYPIRTLGDSLDKIPFVARCIAQNTQTNRLDVHAEEKGENIDDKTEFAIAMFNSAESVLQFCKTLEKPSESEIESVWESLKKILVSARGHLKAKSLTPQEIKSWLAEVVCELNNFIAKHLTNPINPYHQVASDNTVFFKIPQRGEPKSFDTKEQNQEKQELRQKIDGLLKSIREIVGETHYNSLTATSNNTSTTISVTVSPAPAKRS